MNTTIRWILAGVAVIIVDLIVYIFLGLLLMNYDDFYDESMGEYWSWASMDKSTRLTTIGLQCWNFINLLMIVYVIHQVYRVYNSKHSGKSYCFKNK